MPTNSFGATPTALYHCVSERMRLPSTDKSGLPPWLARSVKPLAFRSSKVE